MTLGSIMTRHVVTVDMDATVEQIKGIFDTFRFHHVIVQENGVAVGIISDRDLLKATSPFIGKLAERPQDLASLQRKAHQVMTRHIVWARPDTPIPEGVMLLLNRRVSCLPVLQQGRCVGVVTTRDLLRWAIKQGLQLSEDDFDMSNAA